MSRCARCHRDLVAELADRLQRACSVGSSARVTPSRLNSALASSVSSAGSRSPCWNEMSITSNRTRARLHLADGEVVVARDERRRSRGCSRRGRSPSVGVAHLDQRRGDVVAAIVAERHQQARRRARACVVERRAVMPKSISASRTSTSAGVGVRRVPAPPASMLRQRRRGRARAIVAPVVARHLGRRQRVPRAAAARRTRCPDADRRGRSRRS